MKDDKFKGFSPQTFQFLKDLELNNNREWFEEHREVYEKELIQPLKSLITYLSPAMKEIDKDFEIKPHKVLSRIYRDTRFSKNKEPYKTSMWLYFQIPISKEECSNYPAFVMEITADSYKSGVGFGLPKRVVMDDFRDNVKFRAEEFQEMTQKTVLDKGFEVNGEEYKRKLPIDLPEYFDTWVQRKTIWVTKTKPIGEEFYSDEILNLLADEFKSLEWLYNFLKESQP